MEVTMTPKQAASLSTLIQRHPNVELTIRQLRDKASILVEFGTECALIRPDKVEGGDAA